MRHTSSDGQHTCDDRCQIFQFQVYAWCVTYALELISTNPTAAERVEADIVGFDPLIGLSEPTPGRVSLMSYDGIDPEHAATVDLSVPLLVTTIYDKDGHPVSPMVVDGWHRIYRARKWENLKTLPALTLRPDTAKAIVVASPWPMITPAAP